MEPRLYNELSTHLPSLDVALGRAAKLQDAVHSVKDKPAAQGNAGGLYNLWGMLNGLDGFLPSRPKTRKARPPQHPQCT